MSTDQNTVTILDPERASRIRAAIGTATIPVLSPTTRQDPLDGKHYYRLDMARLTVDQRKRLIGYLCRESGRNRSDVRRELKLLGLHVLASGTALNDVAATEVQRA